MSPQAVSACGVPILINEHLAVLVQRMSFIRMGPLHADTACGDILYSFHHSGWLSNSDIVVDREAILSQVVVVFCHKYLQYGEMEAGEVPRLLVAASA